MNGGVGINPKRMKPVLMIEGLLRFTIVDDGGKLVRARQKIQLRHTVINRARAFDRRNQVAVQLVFGPLTWVSSSR